MATQEEKDKSVVPQRLGEAINAYLHAQKTEAERRSGIITALRELNDDPDLKYLIQSRAIKHLFTTFGKRTNGMMEVYGIPLIKTPDDKVMLVYTDKAYVEVVEITEDTSEGQPLCQTYSIVGLVDSMARSGESMDESVALKNFFTGPLMAKMTVPDFRQTVRASLDTFAETLKPYGQESAGNA